MKNQNQNPNQNLQTISSQFRTSNDRLKVPFPTIEGWDESRTDQSQRESSDINIIVKRILKDPAHLLAMQRESAARFGDLVGAPTSYDQALDLVNRANSDFMQLPPEVRSAYGNDPSLLIEAIDGAQKGDDRLARILTEQGILAPKPPAHEPSPDPAPQGAPGASKRAPKVSPQTDE